MQEKKAPYFALDVAYWFLRRFQKDNEIPSLMKLMIACYYAQGVYLAIADRPLFEDKILAYEDGPVIPAVYEEFKDKLDRYTDYRLIPIYKDGLKFNPDGSIEIDENGEYRLLSEEERATVIFTHGEYISGTIEEIS